MSKRIAAIQHLQFGHLHVQYEDDSFTLFGRGEWEDLKDLKVGNLYPPEEASDAVERGDAQVESGNATLGLQEGAEGQQPEAGSGDHAVGEEGSEAWQEGIHIVPEPEAEPDGPAATSQE